MTDLVHRNKLLHLKGEDPLSIVALLQHYSVGAVTTSGCVTTSEYNATTYNNIVTIYCVRHCTVLLRTYVVGINPNWKMPCFARIWNRALKSRRTTYNRNAR